MLSRTRADGDVVPVAEHDRAVLRPDERRARSVADAGGSAASGTYCQTEATLPPIAKGCPETAAGTVHLNPRSGKPPLGRLIGRIGDMRVGDKLHA